MCCQIRELIVDIGRLLRRRAHAELALIWLGLPSRALDLPLRGEVSIVSKVYGRLTWWSDRLRWRRLLRSFLRATRTGPLGSSLTLDGAMSTSNTRTAPCFPVVTVSRLTATLPDTCCKQTWTVASTSTLRRGLHSVTLRHLAAQFRRKLGRNA